MTMTDNLSQSIYEAMKGERLRTLQAMESIRPITGAYHEIGEQANTCYVELCKLLAQIDIKMSEYERVMKDE
jgi:hypothetical protein